MNTGYQPKTMFKYLLYLYCNFRSHNIHPPLSQINILDYSMMRDFRISNHFQFKNALIDAGVIYKMTIDADAYRPYTDENGIYHKGKAAEYMVDCRRYIEVLNSITARKGFELEIFEDLFKLCDSIEQYLPEKINGFHYAFQFRFTADVKEKYPRVKDNKRWKVEYILNLADCMRSYMMSIIPPKVEDITKLTEDIYHLAEVDDRFFTANYTEEKYDAVQKFLRKVEKQGTTDWKKIQVHTGGIKLTEFDKDMIKSKVRNDFAKNYICQCLLKEKQELDAKGYPFRFSIKTEIEETKCGYRIGFTGRQWNPDCKSRSEIREALYLKNGIDGNYDLHSAIYTVARLMNTGIFDADWDIKAELLKDERLKKIDGTPLTRSDIKMLSMRAFFKSSEAKSYNQYLHSKNNALQKEQEQLYDEYFLARAKGFETDIPVANVDELFPPITAEVYSIFCQDCDELTGGMSKYLYTIFPIESFIEMRVINKLLDRKCTVKNVYDCFYYKTSEISDDEVKRLVEDAAAEVYSELNAMKAKMDAMPRLKKKELFKTRGRRTKTA